MALDQQLNDLVIECDVEVVVKCLYGTIKFIELFQNTAVKCIRREQNA